MSIYSRTGQLFPKAPFDFTKSLEFLSGFFPTRRDSEPQAQTFTRAIANNGQIIAFQLEPAGSVEDPRLDYTLLSEQPIEAATQSAVSRRISLYLSLDDDLRPFYALGREDPHFAPVVERLYGYHQVKFLTPLEAGCWAILTQRNAMSEARKMRAVLVKKYGTSIEVEGTTHWAFPEPTRLAVANPADLGAIADNERKGEYMQALARAFDSVDEDFMLTAPYEEVAGWLRGIKGIGEWSAAFILLRGLGRPQRVPIERRTVEAVSKVYGGGKLLTEGQVRELAQGYGEWQGYWAHYLRAAS